MTTHKLELIILDLIKSISFTMLKKTKDAHWQHPSSTH